MVWFARVGTLFQQSHLRGGWPILPVAGIGLSPRTDSVAGVGRLIFRFLDLRFMGRPVFKVGRSRPALIGWPVTFLWAYLLSRGLSRELGGLF